LDKQLSNRAKKNQYGFIAVGSATDAYMQVEEEIGLTRELLQIIYKHKFPVFISTKSSLIERDFDLLKQIEEAAILPDDLKETLKRGVIISFSFSTLDETLAGKLESGAPSPQERLETLKKCKEEGFFCGVNAIPLLPFISDTEEELEKMISSAKEAGADFILTGGLTLFGSGERDSKQLYFRFLENQYPHLLEKFKKMYGSVFYPSFKYQEDLKKRAGVLCKKYNIKNCIL
jgi:DNA repair photolyase